MNLHLDEHKSGIPESSSGVTSQIRGIQQGVNEGLQIRNPSILSNEEKMNLMSMIRTGLPLRYSPEMCKFLDCISNLLNGESIEQAIFDSAIYQKDSPYFRYQVSDGGLLLMSHDTLICVLNGLNKLLKIEAHVQSDTEKLSNVTQSLLAGYDIVQSDYKGTGESTFRLEKQVLMWAGVGRVLQNGIAYYYNNDHVASEDENHIGIWVHSQYLLPVCLTLS